MLNKKVRRLRRHRSIMLGMQGSADKPRLVIQRSINNLSAQIVDDTQNKTLFSLSTLNKEIKKSLPCGNIKQAELFGQIFSQKAKAKGITRIVFDRAGLAYHGRIKVFAEALRKGGLQF